MTPEAQGSGWARRMLIGAAVGVMGTVLGTAVFELAHFGRVLSDELAAGPVWRSTVESRLGRLENGESTPMAKDTRERFAATAEDRARLWHDVDELKRRVEQLEHRR